MKKLLSVLLSVLMVLSLAACSNKSEGEGTDTETTTALAVCIASEPDTIDPALNSSVDGATLIAHLFQGLAKWEEDANGNLVIAADAAEELVEPVENADGSLTLTYEPAFVAPTEAEDIVNALYALEEGATLPEGPYTLTGTITSVDTAYDLGYENVTVTMVVGDMEDKPVTCYRLKGTGADVIGVGDEITVTGNLKNHYGTYEFTSGCTLDSYVDNPDPTPADLVVPEDATEVEIIELANTLVPGQSLVGDQTVTGVITEINTPYDEGYKNITVTIQVGDSADTQILVFRMKGEGAADLAVGDKITVTGKITNYKGTVEFDAGTTFVMADGGQQEEIPNKGDNFLPIAIVLFAGVALVAVGVVGKKKFA